MNAKNPSGLGIRKPSKATHSLSRQSWRAIAADELEASISLLGEMIATFAAMSTTLSSINDDLKQVTR
jgi:hypothetical protein